MYRFRQFFDALTARAREENHKALILLLTPRQRDLFRQMAPNDQRHSLNVCATLRQAGHEDRDLLVAALLHDVGKSATRIWLWQRALIVLLERWAPGLLAWLARSIDDDPGPWWRRSFVVHRQHPQVGAQWAAKAGCSPTTVNLIRRHQERIPVVQDDLDRLLAILQWADGVN